MFRRLPDGHGEKAVVTIDGRVVEARIGDTVAAAMLANGYAVCRTTAVTGSNRGPYCMMGVCFDCLVVVDGVGSRQGCLIPVRDGMRIDLQKGRREAGR